jgi:hypothetical protein
MIFEDLGENMFVADFEVAPGPSFTNRSKQRHHSFPQKWSDAEERSVPRESGRETAPVETATRIQGSLDDGPRDPRGHSSVEGAAGAQEILELILRERNNISRAITTMKRRVDQQELLHLFNRVSSMTGIKAMWRWKPEFSFPRTQRVFPDPGPAGHRAHGPELEVSVPGCVRIRVHRLAHVIPLVSLARA